MTCGTCGVYTQHVLSCLAYQECMYENTGSHNGRFPAARTTACFARSTSHRNICF